MSESMDAKREPNAPDVVIDPGLDANKVRERLAARENDLKELLNGETGEEYKRILNAAQTALADITEARRQFELQLEPLSREHSFRQALLENSALVDFIHNDLEWLRLILLMFGGVPNLHLAGFVTQYQEIANVLQMDDSTRPGFINRLQRRPYWQQRWDGEDVVYNLAVYLDTECGTGLKAAKRASLIFDPLFICLDSVLSPFLLSRLRDRVPGKSLVDPLLDMARNHADPIQCASALLALLAVDPASVLDDLVRFSREASSRNVIRVFQNLLSQRLSLFRDGVILYSATSKLNAAISPLTDTVPPNKLEDIISLFCRSFCAVLPGPPDWHDLESWMHLPYVNAEIWGIWLSGACGADGVYNFAVILDTIGKRIHSADAIANLHRTHMVQSQHSAWGLEYPTWALDPIPPVWDNIADMYGDALTIAQDSRSRTMKELLHTGIIAYSGIELQNAGDLKIDAFASTLLLPDSYFFDAIDHLDPDLPDQDYYNIEPYVIGKARQISDSTVQARVLWRIARSLMYWGNVSFLDTAIAACAKIGPGLQRARAYERLVKDAPITMRAPLLQQVREAVSEIPDANNRTRALCRLALLSAADEREGLFCEAIEQLRLISDDAERAETLVLMRKVLVDYDAPVDVLDEIAETEADAWYRHKSMGLLSFELTRLHHRLDHPADSTPVILHTILTDVVNLLDRNQEASDSWWQLAQREQREAAFHTILANIARSDAGTLPFNQTAYSALTALAADGGVALATELLPHLTLANTKTFPELHTWFQHPPHECYLPYAHLLAAESGRLDATTLPQLLNLLQDKKDVARYRAALVLHSGQVFIGKPDPQHRVSALGLDAILQISEFVIRMREQGRLGPANSAHWTWTNVVFDDPQILDGLVRCVEQEPQRRQAAAALISSLLILTEASQNRFVELLLTHRSGLAAQPLLEGFCSVSHEALKFSIAAEHIEAVNTYWQSLPGESIEMLRGLPDRIKNVANVIMGCANEANAVITAATLDAALREHSITAPESSPATLGECRTYRLAADPSQALLAAQNIAESPIALRSLFTWLQASLAESVSDPTPFYRKNDTLLEIAGYCGQYSPAAVFNLVDELDLQDLLVKAIIHQPQFNGRAGAVTLLGYLRTPKLSFLTALKSAMTDTAEVQQAALAMIRRLRYVNPMILPELIELLKEDDTALAYAASRLLSLIARHERTSDTDRKAIVRALSLALKSPTACHTVCAFEHAVGSMWISKLGTLAQRHYQSLMEIVNVT